MAVLLPVCKNQCLPPFLRTSHLRLVSHLFSSFPRPSLGCHSISSLPGLSHCFTHRKANRLAPLVTAHPHITHLPNLPAHPICPASPSPSPSPVPGQALEPEPTARPTECRDTHAPPSDYTGSGNQDQPSHHTALDSIGSNPVQSNPIRRPSHGWIFDQRRVAEQDELRTEMGMVGASYILGGGGGTDEKG